MARAAASLLVAGCFAAFFESFHFYRENPLRIGSRRDVAWNRRSS
jgi:hypothetical protein